MANHHNATPILGIIDGEGLDIEQIHRAEFEAGMKLVADAYKKALELISPGHPDEGFLLQAWGDARQCAGLSRLETAEDGPSLQAG